MKLYPFVLLALLSACKPSQNTMIKPAPDLVNAGLELPEGWYHDVVFAEPLTIDKIESGPLYKNEWGREGELSGFAIAHLWVAKDGGVRLVASDSQSEVLKDIASTIGMIMRFKPATWNGHPFDSQVRIRIDFDRESETFDIEMEDPPFESFPFSELIQPRDLDPDLAVRE